MLTWWNVLCIVLHMHYKERRNACELRLYAIDDLRRLYQVTDET